MSFYFSKIVNYSFEETLFKVNAELMKEGFGVLSEIDVQATLKKKLNIDFRKYKILGACNPTFAFKALSTEDKVGVLLPCNVVVQEKSDNKIEIAIINPIEAMQVVNNNALDEIATEVTIKLQKVLENI
ncbi:MAG: DUF302 domain-containing protein [Melioribacteraceae bacterium]